MTHSLRSTLRVAGLLIIAAASSACAYQYAGEQAPDRHYKESESEDDARVVEIQDDEQEGRVQTSSEQKAKAPDSPCGVETFEVRHYGPETQITRTIDCRSREVVKVDRAPIGQQRLTTLRDRGYPEDAWYVLVDPEGLRSNYVNNVEMMKIRQHFEMSFEGKDQSEDLMIYTLEEQLD